VVRSASGSQSANHRSGGVAPQPGAPNSIRRSANIRIDCACNCGWRKLLRAQKSQQAALRLRKDLAIQEAALKAAGCEVICAEKRSGTTTEGREELRTVLDFLRRGDVLMVTRIDRLARSIGDLQDIVRHVKARGASLKATEQPIDTGTAAGKCFLDMLGVFAEFETNLRRERQLEGIAKAKAAGVYKGRPASINAARVRECLRAELRATKRRGLPRSRRAPPDARNSRPEFPVQERLKPCCRLGLFTGSTIAAGAKQI
jgi:DNA invertase Pin-like site-specific DNA recombinase